ncbi:hypothetical protein [Bailinhaonella thermotolerans]|uniref:Uncharacterized protein n=1 Tax=Bailinhaonella thermotolerans TaxID=1070861 RepID=A0A3A4BKG1_9ACTN|nr:hypothetical protein [Bailinhaonella thermotolerans]RJL35814.1 hypothetical protein D5H75_03270 [Bailinhaonella thermotolerans]
MAGAGRSPGGLLKTLEALARSGAHRETWQITRALLPALLAGPGERATTVHTRVVSFAADVAEWAGARGELPEIAALAARPGSSHLTRHARRLHATLTA